VFYRRLRARLGPKAATVERTELAEKAWNGLRGVSSREDSSKRDPECPRSFPGVNPGVNVGRDPNRRPGASPGLHASRKTRSAESRFVDWVFGPIRQDV